MTQIPGEDANRRRPAETWDAYAVPESLVPPKPNDWRAKDASVTAEPWYEGNDFLPGPDELRFGHAAPEVWGAPTLGMTAAELAEHSVWDEPAISAQLTAGPGPQDLTWFRYYTNKVTCTSRLRTWLITAGIVLMSGPLAMIGLFVAGFWGEALWMMVLFGPTLKELLKIALPLWVVEKRPWLFSSGWQIILCSASAGFVFAALENVVYLTLYIPNASADVIAWRWTVCVAVHVICSTVAASGLVQVRRGMLRRGGPPQLYEGGQWIIAAIVLHGLYNGVTLALGIADDGGPALNFLF